MAWIYLFFAGLLETGWAVGLRYSEGFTKLWPSVWTVLAMIASFYLLALSLRTLPLGTAYAVWTGIGTVGTIILSLFLFGEAITALRAVFLAMILGGIIGLKLIH
jgi:quaternary ammonium compound-resistance protein SugE